MNPIPRITAILVFLGSLATLVHSAPSDRELKEMLDTADRTRFSGAFCIMLRGLPPAEIPAFRKHLTDGLLEQGFPRRHAWQALGLTDTRWAETDPDGYLKACKDGLKEVPVAGRITALRQCLKSGVKPALDAFNDLGRPTDLSLVFLPELAASDPEAALTELTTRQTPPAGLDHAVLKAWAAKDVAAAWNAIPRFPKLASPESYPSETTIRRGIVLAAAATKDPAAALALASDLSPTERAAAVSRAIERCTVPETALALARAVDTETVWRAFAVNVRYGADDETLRKLLEILPENHRRAALTELFTHDRFPDEPAARFATRIPLLPDSTLRRDMFAAAMAVRPVHEHRLPVNLAEAGSVIMPDLLATPGTFPDLGPLTIAMVQRGQTTGVADYLSHSRAAGDRDATIHELAKVWPRKRLATDAIRFLKDSVKAVRRLGEDLSCALISSDPVTAFQALSPISGESEEADSAISRATDELISSAGKDPAKVEALLKTLPDVTRRERALRRFTVSRMALLPPAEAFASFRTLIENNTPSELRTYANAYTQIASRPEPEFDALINSLPDKFVSHRDELLTDRSEMYLSNGMEREGLAALRGIRDENQFTENLSRILADPRKYPLSDWETVFTIIAGRADSNKSNALLDRAVQSMIESDANAAIALAEHTDNPAIRNALARELEKPENRRPNIAEAEDWFKAVEMGLDKPQGKQLAIKAVNEMARTNPAKALRDLLQTGPSALRSEFVLPIADALMVRDPEAAFRLYLAEPSLLADRLASILSRWAHTSPAQATKASLGLSNPTHRAQALQVALSRWLETDESAALGWTRSLPPGPDRETCLNHAANFFHQTQPRRALAIHRETHPRSPTLLTAIAAMLAETNYAEAATIMLESAETGEPGALRGEWQRIIVPWLDSDPSGATAFLAKLEPPATGDSTARSIHVRELNRGLANGLRSVPKLRPQPANLPPSAFLSVYPSNDNTPRSPFPLPEADFKERLATISAMPASHGKVREVNDLILRVLATATDHEFLQILALCNSWDPDNAGFNPVQTPLGTVLSHLLTHAPDRIPALFKLIAAETPEFLGIAVDRLFSEQVRSPGTPEANASILTMLPKEDRVRIFERHLLDRPPSYPAIQDAILNPDRNQSTTLAKSADPIRRFLTGNLSDTLAAAATGPDTDSLVIRILAAFPDAASANAALSAIPDAPSRERAAAWLRAIHPPTD